MSHSREEGSEKKKRAKIISIVSVKGGVGKTTVASNLGVSLSRTYGKKTLLVDCDFDLPSVGFHLNMLDPDITLHDVLDGRFPLNEAVHAHADSGLDVILGSLSGDSIVSGGMADLIEQQLSGSYEWIIIDTNPALDQNLRNVIKLSDEALIISSPDFPSISGSLKAIKAVEECGVKVRGVVLNKVTKKSYELVVGEIEDTLGHPVISIIPEDSKIKEALSQRKPVVLYAPKTPSGKELKRLAGTLAEGIELKKAGPGGFSSLICRLFGR
jgi:MinD-like ATPase involved in chromosome partitioning or flagellar assembly